MVIDMDLFLDIVNITKKGYDFRPINDDNTKVMVASITQLLEDLVDAFKEV